MSNANRRFWLRHGCRMCLGLGAYVAGKGSFAQATPEARTNGPLSPDVAIPGRLSRPAFDTDEGGLWSLMDREESRLRRSQFSIHDPVLGKYLQSLVERLVEDHRSDVRVYAVRTPVFNANMAPNGMMQVWSGLLLRVENEAQLAAVVGHELGHYLERHTVEQLRDLKNRTAFAQFLGMFGLVGAVGQMGVLAGAFAFSREHESRADRMGVRLMKRAGYDGREAAQIWDNLLGELKVTGGQEVGKRSPMMATHPPVESRRDDLLRWAGEAGGDIRAEDFRRAVSSHRMTWLGDEIRRGQYEESLILFDRLLRLDNDDGPVLFARGEVFRLRGNQDDLQSSLRDLQSAVRSVASPPEAFRSLGLVHRQRGDREQAASAFEQYLLAVPQAADVGLIKSYLTEMK